MEAIILAGGLGTRLRSVVSDVPKPMAVVNGYPFLRHLLSYWSRQGVTRFFLSIGYKAEMVQNYFGNQYMGAPIEYFVEKTQLGTGGAVLNALKTISKKGPILLLNGDTLFRVNLESFFSLHDSKNSRFSMSLFSSSEERYLSVNVDSKNRIIRFNQKETSGQHRFVNGGVYLLDPTLFNDFECGLERPISLEAHLILELFKKGIPLYGFPFGSFFIDIGVPEDYARSFQFLRGEALSQEMEKI